MKTGRIKVLNFLRSLQIGEYFVVLVILSLAVGDMTSFDGEMTVNRPNFAFAQYAPRAKECTLESSAGIRSL